MGSAAECLAVLHEVVTQKIPVLLDTGMDLI